MLSSLLTRFKIFFVVFFHLIWELSAFQMFIDKKMDSLKAIKIHAHIRTHMCFDSKSDFMKTNRHRILGCIHKEPVTFFLMQRNNIKMSEKVRFDRKKMLDQKH